LPAPDGPPDDQVDHGEPVEALSQLDEPVSASLLRRVRGSIQRRMLAAQLAEILPGTLDTLTPEGRLPEAGAFEQALGLLKGRLG